jgi:hypothetical protein
MVALVRLGDLGAGGAGEGMPPRGDARGKVKTTRRRARAKASETTVVGAESVGISYNKRSNERGCVGANL